MQSVAGPKKPTRRRAKKSEPALASNSEAVLVPDKVQNPKVIVATIKMIREEICGDEQKEFLERINGVDPRAEQNKERWARLHNKFSLSMIKSYETNRSAFVFWELEQYAWLIGIPLGLLLLFTHLKSKRRDNEEVEFARIRERSLQALNSGGDGKFDAEHLRSWMEIFDKKIERRPKKTKKRSVKTSGPAKK